MPDTVKIRDLLAEASNYLACGQEEAALERYDRVLDLDSDHAEALFMRGVALRLLGRRMLEAAADSYRRAIAADPQYAPPHFQLIRLAYTLEQLDGIIRTYKDRILENRVEPRNYAYLGFALLTAGDVESALRVVETGLAIGPTDAYLQYTYGEILRAAGQLRDAAQAWQTAIEYEPNLIDALYALAEACEELGDDHMASRVRKELVRRLEEQNAPRQQIAEIQGQAKGTREA